MFNYNAYLNDLLNEKNDNIIYDKYNIIFKYELLDAWRKPIKSIIVTSDSKDNLYLYSEEEKKYHIDESKVLTILKNSIKNIKTEGALPFIPVMDGYKNSIDFKVDGKWYNYEITNLGYYSKDEIDGNEFLSWIVELLIEVDDELERQVPMVANCFIPVDDD